MKEGEGSRLKILGIYRAVVPLGAMLLLTGCAPDQPVLETIATEEAVYLLPEETKEPERLEPQTEETAVVIAGQTEPVTPQEALTAVFDWLYVGSRWYEMAVLHTEDANHPYYMGEILYGGDGRVITDTKLIAEFWMMYPQMSQAKETAEDDGWREKFQFGYITGQQNRYLEYSGLAANGETYIFRLYSREWTDIYAEEAEESIQNFYAYVPENGTIVPMYLYRGTENEKFNEHYAEVTALK